MGGRSLERLYGITWRSARCKELEVLPSSQRGRLSRVVPFFYGHFPIECETDALPAYELSQFAIGHKLHLVFLEKPAKLVTREEIEIALSPRRSPIRMVDRRRAHLFIVVSEMNDQLGHSRLKLLHGVDVELFPMFWCNVGNCRDGMVNEHFARLYRRRWSIRASQPLLREHNRNLVIARDFQEGVEQSLICVERSHMRIE